MLSKLQNNPLGCPPDPGLILSLEGFETKVSHLWSTSTGSLQSATPFLHSYPNLCRLLILWGIAQYGDGKSSDPCEKSLYAASPKLTELGARSHNTEEVGKARPSSIKAPDVSEFVGLLVL